MAARYIDPVPQYGDTGGESIAGARLFFFAAGTSTPLDTFADETLVTPNSNPVVCDADGRVPDIFLNAVDYKVILKEAAEDVTIWERDPVDGASGSGSAVQGVANYASLDALKTNVSDIYYVRGRLTEGDGGQGFWYEVSSTTLTDDAGSIRTATDALSTRIRLFDGRMYDARWYGVVGDHTAGTLGSGTDNTTAINTALTAIAANITQDSTDIGFLNAITFWMPAISGLRQNRVRHTGTINVPGGVNWRFDCPTYAEKTNIFEPAFDFAQGSHLEHMIAWVNSGSGIRLGGGAAQNEMRVQFFKLNNVGETATGTTPFVDQQMGCQLRGFNFFIGDGCEVVGGNIAFDYNAVSDVSHGGKMLAVTSSTGFRITSGCEHITNFKWVADSCNFKSGQIDSSNNIKGFAEAFFNETAFPTEGNNTSGIAFTIGEFSSGDPVNQCQIDFQISNTDGVGVKFFYTEDSQYSVSVSNALQTATTEPTTFAAEFDATGFSTARQETTAIRLNGTPSTGFWQTTLGRPAKVAPLWENGDLFTSGDLDIGGISLFRDEIQADMNFRVEAADLSKTGGIALNLGRMSGALTGSSECFVGPHNTGGPGSGGAGGMLYVARGTGDFPHDWFTNDTLRMTLLTGLVVGAPTGGDKGVGTINATSVFDDGVLLTCYPLEAELDGLVDLIAWDARVPNTVIAAVLDADGNEIKAEQTIVRTHQPAADFALRATRSLDPDLFYEDMVSRRALPAMPTKDEWATNGPLSSGEVIQKLWETIETMAIHDKKQGDLIKALETRVTAIESP